MEKTNKTKLSDEEIEKELHKILEHIIKDGNPRYAETACDIDRLRAQEQEKARQQRKKKK